MKRWHRYEHYLLSGLWHVHTDRTDGSNSIEELLSFATANRFPLIGFVEHIRRTPTYDFHEFYDEVHRRAKPLGIETAVGCEAKVLNAEGDLDVSRETADSADVVYAAFHGTPFERDAYLQSVTAMLDNPIVDVWAHPFRYAHREGFAFTDREIASVLERAARNHVLLEYTVGGGGWAAAYGLEIADFGILGYDLHDLDRWTRPSHPGGDPSPNRHA